MAPGTCQPTTVLVIHLAILPVQTSLAGGSPCLAILAIQKWFWDFFFLLWKSLELVHPLALFMLQSFISSCIFVPTLDHARRKIFELHMC